MSKHDVIIDNLAALTKCSSFERGIVGWSVTKLIALGAHQRQSCELCGTHFRKGAIVKHSRSGSRIVVGGTCLTTLQRQRFPPRFRIQKAKQATMDILRQHYRRVVHPGTWIQWVIEHAPKRLAQPVADLRSFGLVVNSKELEALIRFHDKTRLFPRRALIEDWRFIESVLSIKIPPHITFLYALHTLEKFGATARDPELRLRIESQQYMKREVLPFVHRYSDLTTLWRSLQPHEKRGFVALAALDGRASKQNVALCSDELTEMWPAPGIPPLFTWNNKIGLGFVGPADRLDGEKSHVWLWRSGRYRRGVYDLRYWRGISGCSMAAVHLIEELAFPDGDTRN